MSVSKRAVGTGITAEPRTEYSGDDMLPAVRDWVAKDAARRQKAGSAFGAKCLRIVEHAQWILAGDGPDSRDTQKDFARRILASYEIALALFVAGKADEAMANAVDVGFLYSQASMKARWEPTVRDRQEHVAKFDEGRKRGARRQTAERQPEWRRWQTCANEIWSVHADWGKLAVAQRVKEQLRLSESVETIKPRIKKGG